MLVCYLVCPYRSLPPSAEHAWLLSLAIIFGLDSLNIILAILRGCILSLSQDAEREAFFLIITPNVLCSSVLIIIMIPSVFIHLVCPCVGLSICEPIKVHTSAVVCLFLWTGITVPTHLRALSGCHCSKLRDQYQPLLLTFFLFLSICTHLSLFSVLSHLHTCKHLNAYCTKNENVALSYLSVSVFVSKPVALLQK